MLKSRIYKSNTLPTENVYIDGSSFLGKLVVVGRKAAELDNYMNYLRSKPRSELKKVSKSALRAAKDADVDAIKNKALAGDELEWENYCTDIVIVAVCRMLLYKKPLELRHQEELIAMGIDVSSKIQIVTNL